MKQTKAPTTSEASAASGPAQEERNVYDLYGNDAHQRMLDSGLSEEEIAATSGELTGNSQRYLVNDEESRMRVGDDGIIRASHSETHESNKASADAFGGRNRHPRRPNLGT